MKNLKKLKQKLSKVTKQLKSQSKILDKIEKRANEIHDKWDDLMSEKIYIETQIDELKHGSR